MPDVSEIIDELIEQHRVPRGAAYRIVGRLLEIGAETVPFRPDKVKEIVEAVAEDYCDQARIRPKGKLFSVALQCLIVAQ